MRPCHRIRAALLSVALAFSGQAYGESLLEHAEARIRDGDLAAAAELYERLLAERPDDLQALLGRATVRSWQGDHVAAQRDFRAVLQRQPEHLGALVGLAYDLAWAGQYDAAEGEFRRALELAPDNPGAAKGLAYVALWRGNPDAAVERFDALAAAHPEDIESQLALGQAHLQAWQTRRAAAAFDRALALEPGNPAASGGLQAAYDAPAALEAHLWAGSTSDAGSGLRQLELATWVQRDWRLWFRYDNSLTLDNPILSSRGEEAEAYVVGAFHAFNPRWLGSVELGRRDLPEDQSQDLLKLEATRLSQERAYKLGAQLAPHSEDYTDRLLYAGVSLPLGPRWRLEPTVYLARSGPDADREWRVVGRAGYRAADGWSLNLHLGVGHIDTDATRSGAGNARGGGDGDGSVSTAGVQWRLPVGGYHSLALAVNHESTPSQDTTTTMLGLTLRLPRM